MIRDIKHLAIGCVTMPLMFCGFGIMATGAIIFGVGAAIESKTGIHNPVL